MSVLASYVEGRTPEGASGAGASFDAPLSRHRVKTPDEYIMQSHNARPPLYVPDDATLRSDPTTLMSHLLDASKYARGSVDGGGIARLLEAAATSIQQLQAESSVQRGLAVASQTLATELALRIEQLQVWTPRPPRYAFRTIAAPQPISALLAYPG